MQRKRLSRRASSLSIKQLPLMHSAPHASTMNPHCTSSSSSKYRAPVSEVGMKICPSPHSLQPILYACRSYWLGYRATVWGVNLFRPLDKTMPGPPYNNWGTMQPQNQAEPNGRTVPELCLVANSSQAGQDSTFAWADAGCFRRFPFMCRVMREWLLRFASYMRVSHACCRCGRCWVLQAGEVQQSEHKLQLWYHQGKLHIAGQPANLHITPSHITHIIPVTLSTALHPAVPTVVNFTSNVTGSTYTLNTNKMVSRDAQAYCNLQGGHLAAYTSYDEQAEVEAYFTSQVRH